ncbi:hypothetical protein E1A91_D01G238500v1, partial [Gossypium mustelinum]
QIEIQLSDDSNSQEIRLSLLSAFENISFVLSFNPGFLVLSSPRQEHAGPDLLLSGRNIVVNHRLKHQQIPFLVPSYQSCC